MKRLKSKKGFTMAELLIVVAIIAVLVAISIPIFTSRLEAAREATDAANIRDYYTEISVALLDDTLNTQSGNDTMTLTGGATAKCEALTGALAGTGFKVTVSGGGFKVHQKKKGWDGGRPEVAGVTVGDITVDNPSSLNNVVYTFTVDSAKQKNTYLSAVAYETTTP